MASSSSSGPLTALIITGRGRICLRHIFWRGSFSVDPPVGNESKLSSVNNSCVGGVSLAPRHLPVVTQLSPREHKLQQLVRMSLHHHGDDLSSVKTAPFA